MAPFTTLGNWTSTYCGALSTGVGHSPRSHLGRCERAGHFSPIPVTDWLKEINPLSWKQLIPFTSSLPRQSETSRDPRYQQFEVRPGGIETVSYLLQKSISILQVVHSFNSSVQRLFPQLLWFQITEHPSLEQLGVTTQVTQKPEHKCSANIDLEIIKGS